MEMLKAKPERDRQRFSITYLQSKVESLLTFYGSEMESNVYPGAATAPRAAGMCLLSSSVWFGLFYFFPLYVLFSSCFSACKPLCLQAMCGNNTCT